MQNMIGVMSNLFKITLSLPKNKDPMEIEKRKKRSLVWFISILLVVMFAISFTSYYGRGLLYAELNNLKLIPRSEHFTELYFENSSSLPKSTVRGLKASFAFTI